MRIFNWVQKKLHQNVIKDGVTKNVKKINEGSEIEKNTKAILEQVGLVDAFDNWFDGVLTIGTFGFDNLKSCDENDENDEKDEKDDDECESVDLDYLVIDGSIVKNVDEELDPLISVQNKFDHDHNETFEIFDIDESAESMITVENSTTVTTMDNLVREKRRTTLADLFMEDGGCQSYSFWLHNKFKNLNLEYDNNINNNNNNNKYSYEEEEKESKLSNELPFTKKMIKNDSHSIKKKLHKMIKKMMKKKIHPDIDATKQHKSKQTYESVESLHLLNIQDIVA